MCNHTADVKNIVIAARTLAIALLTTGMASLAASAQPSHDSITFLSYEVDFQPAPPYYPHAHLTQLAPRHVKIAQICSPTHTVCPPGNNGHCCDSDMACRYTHAPPSSFVGWSPNPTCEPPLGPGNACLDDNECISGVCQTIPDHPETHVSPTGRVGRCQ